MANLNLIAQPDARFVVKNPSGNTKFSFRGNDVDLKNIDETVALSIAADKGCKFLRLKADVDAEAAAATATAQGTAPAAPAPATEAPAPALPPAPPATSAATDDKSKDAPKGTGKDGAKA